MATLTKRTYVDGTTKITATNMNDIQDHIIALEEDAETYGTAVTLNYSTVATIEE
jgi:hypothetical protein